MDSIIDATEPLTTHEFFALDVDEKLKVELTTPSACKPYFSFFRSPR